MVDAALAIAARHTVEERLLKVPGRLARSVK